MCALLHLSRYTNTHNYTICSNNNISHNSLTPKPDWTSSESIVFNDISSRFRDSYVIAIQQSTAARNSSPGAAHILRIQSRPSEMHVTGPAPRKRRQKVGMVSTETLRNRGEITKKHVEFWWIFRISQLNLLNRPGFMVDIWWHLYVSMGF